jgi:4-amino-4-deoxy-L-arabinose transferase-like glycosyltransferase
MRGAVSMLALLCGVSFLLLFHLGRATLNAWDEAIYAQIAKEIVHDGDWLTLHWGNEPWFEKPPLFMWSTAVLFRFFGVNECSARLSSALCGILIVFLTCRLGTRTHGRRVGLAAAMVLSSSPAFVSFARSAMTDTMLTLFVVTALYSYARVKEGSSGSWYAVWVSCALGAMVKSAAALVAPIAIALDAARDGRLRSFGRSANFWWALLLGASVVIPWHALMVVEHGATFLDQYWGYHVLARVARPLEGNSGSRFYYLDHLIYGFYPWSYVAPVAVSLAIARYLEGDERAEKTQLLLALLGTVFCTFTLARTKIDSYILPLYPVLSILVAAVIGEAIESGTAIARGGLFAAAVVASVTPPYPLSFTLLLASVIAVGWAVAQQRYDEAAGRRRATSVAAIAFLLGVALIGLYPLYLGDREPVAVLARAAAALRQDDRAPLLLYPASQVARPTALYYSDLAVEGVENLDELRRFVGGAAKVTVISTEQGMRAIAASYETHLVAQAGDRVLLAVGP